MIIYGKSLFSVNILLRIHGSAAYKAIIPALVSLMVYFVARRRRADELNNDDEKLISHPYAVGALISSISFVVIFRANFGYQRYWEGATAIYQMMSKWLDGITMTGAFHYQSKHYDAIKPPTFFDHPGVNFRSGLKRRRVLTPEDIDYCSMSELNGDDLDDQSQAHMNGYAQSQSSTSTGTERVQTTLSINQPHLVRRKSSIRRFLSGSAQDPSNVNEFDRKDNENYNFSAMDMESSKTYEDLECSPFPFRAHHPDRPKFQIHSNQGYHGAGQVDGGVSGEPSLFLQELCHLASLLNAVALSTLRNEIDTAEAPISEYHPMSDDENKSWPPVDAIDPNEKRYILKTIWKGIKYILWLDKSAKDREAYNAAWALEVIGGISDEEALFLRNARGASAKVNLCWFWTIEFITREHLSGSTGAVGPPIISRIYQFMSDGCIGYNSARKTSFIPFPFPHAQISLLALVFLLVAVPLVTVDYTNQDDYWLGGLLTFAVVQVLFGLHEVARELENPFVNVPNHLPLCNIQAQFNESLLQLYNGYHPNHFWNTKSYIFGNRNGACRYSVNYRPNGMKERGREQEDIEAGRSSGNDGDDQCSNRNKTE